MRQSSNRRGGTLNETPTPPEASQDPDLHHTAQRTELLGKYLIGDSVMYALLLLACRGQSRLHDLQ